MKYIGCHHILPIRIQQVVIAALLIVTFSCKNSTKTNPGPVKSQSDSISANQTPAPVYVYGIPSDSFDLIQGRIKQNGFLSEILLKHGITMQQIDQILKNSKSVFDVRSIRSGNDYILFCDKDSNAKARYFVYQHDATTSFVFSFKINTGGFACKSFSTIFLSLSPVIKVELKYLLDETLSE